MQGESISGHPGSKRSGHRISNGCGWGGCVSPVVECGSQVAEDLGLRGRIGQRRETSDQFVVAVEPRWPYLDRVRKLAGEVRSRVVGDDPKLVALGLSEGDAAR